MDVKELRKVIAEEARKEIKKYKNEIKKEILSEISTIFNQLLSESLSSVISENFSVRFVPKNKQLSEEYNYSTNEPEEYIPQPMPKTV